MKENDIRPKALFNQYLALSKQDISDFFSDRSCFATVACPACNSKDHTAAFTKLDFCYVTCSVCDSLYLSPRPTEGRIAEYYKRSRAVKFWSEHFFKETVEVRREKMFRLRAERVCELVDQIGIDRAATLAEIGPGYGVFLEEIAKKKRFAKIVGIEPCPALAQDGRNKGFEVVEKAAESLMVGEIGADFTVAFEVLEHVFDPLQFLLGVKNAMKKKGYLLFSTLTATGFDIQVLWEHSKSVYPPHHINLLSVKGIRTLVERVGFRLAELTTPGKLDVNIIENMISDNPQLKLPGFIKILLQQNEKTKEAFQTFLAAHQLSSHIQVLVQNAD